MSFVKDVFNSLTGKTQADAIAKGSEINSQTQGDMLSYLQSVNEVPQQFKEQALGALGDFYLNGNQQGIVNQAQSSPFYNSMINQGEESVLRNQAATGGLRTGGAQQALAQNSQNVLQQLVGQQLGGIGGLASLGTNEQGIANQMGNYGMAQAQGGINTANAQTGALNNLINMGIQGASMAFSDARLKSNIQEVGSVGGEKWHTWTWNDEGEKLGLTGQGEGVVIDKLSSSAQKHVGNSNGYLTFNYGDFLNG